VKNPAIMFADTRFLTFSEALGFVIVQNRYDELDESEVDNEKYTKRIIVRFNCIGVYPLCITRE